MSETKETKALTLEERLNAAVARAEKAERNNEKLAGKVKDLSDELKVKEATAPKGALPTVKVKGKHYQFVSPRFYVSQPTVGVNGKKRMRMSKEVVTAVDAAKNQELCEQLVDCGSGVLKEIVTK